MSPPQPEALAREKIDEALVRAGWILHQKKAIRNLEASLEVDKPRALIQMATGSGKSLTSVAAIYRLIKFGGARRVLFLVDRDNLGLQAEGEFSNYRTYDDHKKFTELYGVQRLQSRNAGPRLPSGWPPRRWRTESSCGSAESRHRVAGMTAATQIGNAAVAAPVPAAE